MTQWRDIQFRWINLRNYWYLLYNILKGNNLQRYYFFLQNRLRSFWIHQYSLFSTPPPIFRRKGLKNYRKSSYKLLVFDIFMILLLFICFSGPAGRPSTKENNPNTQSEIYCLLRIVLITILYLNCFVPFLLKCPIIMFYIYQVLFVKMYRAFIKPSLVITFQKFGPRLE